MNGGAGYLHGDIGVIGNLSGTTSGNAGDLGATTTRQTGLIEELCTSGLRGQAGLSLGSCQQVLHTDTMNRVVTPLGEQLAPALTRVANRDDVTDLGIAGGFNGIAGAGGAPAMTA